MPCCSSGEGLASRMVIYLSWFGAFGAFGTRIIFPCPKRYALKTLNSYSIV